MALRDQVAKAIIAVSLAVYGYFAATVPCSSAEGAVYERYASHTILEMWKSPFDPALGLVYGVLSRLSTRVAGVSEFTIRIPALLGGLLFLLGVWHFCRRWLPGWFSLLPLAALAFNPWSVRLFTTAAGAPLAIGLLLIAVRSSPYPAGLLAALAIGSDARFAAPAFLAAAALLFQTPFWRWVDQCLLPATIAASLLLLPAIFLRPKPVPPLTDDRATRDFVRALMRRHQPNSTLRIGASAAVEPGLYFYRRRYHLDWLLIEPPSPSNDVQLLPGQPLK